MIYYFNSIQIIFDSSRKFLDYMLCENTDLLYAKTKISFSTILSDKNVPAFSNSAMDGYAVRSSYTLTLDSLNSKKFDIVDVIMAGDVIEKNDFDGNCVVEIMTGAKLPDSFDSVVKFEDVSLNLSCDKIILSRMIKLGENVRFIGEDFRCGDCIIKKGKIFNQFHIMSLLACGIKIVNVLKNPVVYLLCTGNEIVDINDNYSCMSNKVNNITASYIISFFDFLDIKVHYLGLVNDNVIDFKQIVQPILNNQFLSLVITTGAVSKGKADFIPAVLKSMGVNVLFHGVKIKPGKPVLFAKYLLNTYFFCLPGNPISSIVGLRFFVYPFLRCLMGQTYEKPYKAVLDSDYLCKRKCDSFLKAYSYFVGSKLYVKILLNQESFKISSMLESNSFIFLKMLDSSKKGDILDVFFYNPSFLNECFL